MARITPKVSSADAIVPIAVPPRRGGVPGGRVSNPTDFGKILYASCAARKMSANEFARRVSLTSGFISAVYSGLKLPPLDRVEGWAATLGLSGHERTAFIVLAHLEHASALVRRWFHQQRQLLMEVSRQGFDLGGLDREAMTVIAKYA